jgi:hypothetical protein
LCGLISSGHSAEFPASAGFSSIRLRQFLLSSCSSVSRCAFQLLVLHAVVVRGFLSGLTRVVLSPNDLTKCLLLASLQHVLSLMFDNDNK